jgi:hypothetical protein
MRFPGHQDSDSIRPTRRAPASRRRVELNGNPGHAQLGRSARHESTLSGSAVKGAHSRVARLVAARHDPGILHGAPTQDPAEVKLALDLQRLAVVACARLLHAP